MSQWCIDGFLGRIRFLWTNVLDGRQAQLRKASLSIGSFAFCAQGTCSGLLLCLD